MLEKSADILVATGVRGPSQLERLQGVAIDREVFGYGGVTLRKQERKQIGGEGQERRERVNIAGRVSKEQSR